MDQYRTPLYEAVQKYVDEKVVRFHVPGHKQGRNIPELVEFIGQRALSLDVNGMADLDYANNPSGVILEAQMLMAEAFEASRAYFLVNGTTSGVQAMIMSTCQPGDEIIIPRNAHRSTIGGLILSGAIPVYVQPEYSQALGIPLGVDPQSLVTTLKQHPAARAVLVINPTYYGFASDLRHIVDLVHRHDKAVLVDEAHGAHMYFHSDFPLTAMEAGADMSAVSLHKTGGSLTQSSVLLVKGDRVPEETVAAVLNLTYTSSASYLLMCSLDIARKTLAVEGRARLSRTLELVRHYREEINRIPGFYAFGTELIGTPGCYSFDESKLGINLRQLGCTGYDLEARLRSSYHIQMELSDLYNTLAILSIDECEADLACLVEALSRVRMEIDGHNYHCSVCIPDCPEMVVTPREAFYCPKTFVPLMAAVGEISGEMIMAYPPGIPLICPGERITRDIVDYINVLKCEQCELQGASDRQLEYLSVLRTSK